MRILFTLVPENSIFNYFVPLAWACRSAGHEVRIASQPQLTSAVTAAGLTAVPVGANRSPWRLMAGQQEKLDSLRAGAPAPYTSFADAEPAPWDVLLAGMNDAVRGWHRLSNFPMISDLVAYAKAWKPDLIIWDPLCYAGPIAAKACGAAHARLLWGIDVLGVTRNAFLRRHAEQPLHQRADPLAEWLGSYGHRYGFAFTEDMTTGQFTIDQLPRSLRMTTALDKISFQYIPYGGPAIVSNWLRSKPQRPRVGLTMGITATEIFGDYKVLYPEIINSLGTLDIDLYATIADSQRKKLGPLPSNVHIASYVPWHVLAPSCSAVVQHAGAATLATTARYAVPQLSLPYHFDQPYLANRLAQQGAGLTIDSTIANGSNVRAGVQQLLNDDSFATRADVLRREIRAMPTPSEIVPTIEKRARETRTC